MNGPRIWCAVSGHGFGHWSQVAPVLNQLAKRFPGLTVHVCGQLPGPLLARTLDVPYTHTARAQDVGLVQSDPMLVDVAATRTALAALHGDWHGGLEQERRELAAWSPDLLLADIPCRPIEAASLERIPSAAIASLSWDHVLAAYLPLSDPVVQGWWQTMRHAYALTDLALLPEPTISASTFPQATAIPPITVTGRRRSAELRAALGLDRADDRPLVGVTLGGIPATTLPVRQLLGERRCHWLMDVPIPPGSDHLHDMRRLPGHWPFVDLTASVDALVSKPGYGMAISSVAHGVPFLFSRRGIFPDEAPIAAWLERHGRARELDREQFQSGAWAEAIFELLARDAPPRPPLDGAERAAECLASRFFSG